MRINNKGYFILTAFLLMIILSSLAVTYSIYVNRQLKFLKKAENNCKLEKIALSGLSYAKAMLNKNPSFRGGKNFVKAGEGRFYVLIKPAENNKYIVKCKAFYKNSSIEKKFIIRL